MIDIRGNGRRATLFLHSIAIRYIRGLKVLATGSVSRVRRGFTAIRDWATQAYRSMKMKLSIVVALFWHRVYIVRYYVSRWKLLHGASTSAVGLIVLVALTAIAVPALQRALDSHFHSDQSLATLRTLIVTMGGALVGAAAIVFSIVLFAVQINFARMPHGLFRKLSSDMKLLSCFAASFLLAIGVATCSLIPNKSWVALAILTATWATIIFLILSLYGYRRALLLINPSRQLQLIVKSAEQELRAWTRRARRAAPLFQSEEPAEGTTQFRPMHDMPRVLYFRTNPHWTDGSRRAITHAVSFARRYAEEGDHEVSGLALSSVVAISAAYVNAKGKTFFTTHLLFDNPLATDGFINETLEHLRQTVRIAITRGDERQIEQTLQTLAALVAVYLAIDYSTEHATKTHANLAAGYLSDAVQSVIPHDMPDVLMEGVRLMGQSAQLFLVKSKSADIANIADRIGLVGCVGITKQNHRPVTLSAMDQLARLTFSLLRMKNDQIRFAAGELKKNVNLVVKLFLTIPSDAFSMHTYLGPYYSLTSEETLPVWLTKLANEIAKADESIDTVRTIIDNVKEWSEELYTSEKELFLAAIERKSNFTFELVHWIAQITKVLIVMADAPSCDRYTKSSLIKHARGLIYVLSWVPDTKEAVDVAERARMTEVLSEAALDAYQRDCTEVYQAARDTLLSWSFKAARHQTSWTVLERSMCALATFALWKPDDAELPTIIQSISVALAKDGAPDQEMRDRAARELRRDAATLRRREFELSPIRNAMNQIDAAKMRQVLQDIANLLSPNTANEPTRIDFF